MGQMDEFICSFGVRFTKSDFIRKVRFNVFKSPVLNSREDWATSFRSNQYQYIRCPDLVSILKVNTYLSK